MSAKIISFFNHRVPSLNSTSASTTSVVNIGTCLALNGYSVLLVDCDPQGNMSLRFGMYQKENTIRDVMLDEMPVENAIYQYKNEENDIKKLDILPSNLYHAATEMKIFNYPNRERILINALKSVKDKYDYILLDCPPSLGMISLNALSVSTHVVIPMKVGKYSLMGIKALFDTIGSVRKHFNENLIMAGFFITQDEPNTVISKEIKNELNEKLSDKVFESMISRTVKVVESEVQEIPMVLYNKDNKVTKEYMELTKELIERVK